MQQYTIKKGTTSKILMIDIYDSSSTVGARLAGLVYNSAGLSAYYNREGAAGAATAITLATAIKGTWATGGFIAIDATNMPGHYELHIPDAALATGANSVMVELKGAANMVPKTILIELVDNVEADTYAIANHATYGNSALDTDLNTLLARIIGTLATGTHNPQTGDAFARLGAPAGASIAADLLAIDNFVDDIESRIGTPVGASISADIAGVQADTDNIQTRIPTALVGGRIDASVGAVAANAITATAIADGAIDRATFAADTGLQNIRANTAQAGAASTITLDASASAVDSYYNECWVYITGGTGAGQTRVITAYVGATKVATITPNWTTNPDATSTFAIWGVSRNDGISSGATDWSTAEKNQIRQALGVDGTKAATASGNINTVMADTDDIQTRLPAALVGGRIDSSVGSNLDKTGYALTQAFPTNFASLSITAAGLVDITQAAADKVWSTAARTLTSFGTLIADIWAYATRALTDKADFTISAANRATLVDEVWDEDVDTTHQTAGTAGKKLDDAGGAADPWATAVPGAYGAGTAGNILGNRLDAAMTTRHASGAAVASVTGAVGSVTAGVTVSTNSDKTGYSLSSAGIQAVWDALTSALTTVGSIGKLIVDNVNATISSRSSHTAADVWSAATRTLTSFGTLVSDVWANATRTLTSFGTLISDIWANATRTLTSVGGIKKNTAFNNFDFLMVDSTDHVTGETGLTVTAQRSINGGAFAACANAVSELANGKYLINLAASDLNGDIVALRFTATGADTRNITIITTP